MVAADLSRATTRGSPAWSLYALIAAVGALALAGGVVALGTMSGGDAAEHAVAGHGALHSGRQNDIGRAIPTSFGVVAVESVQKLKGLTPKQLGGMTHFPSWVAPDQMQVQVALELRNLQKHTVRYSSRQFHLRVGSGKPIAPTGGTISKGILQPSAAIDVRLTFVARRATLTTPRLWLELAEPGRIRPIRVDLGPAFTPGPVIAVRHPDHRAPPGAP